MKIKANFKTFFFEPVLKCLQAQGEVSSLLLPKFSDVINVNIFVFMYNVKLPRMKVAYLSWYYVVKFFIELKLRSATHAEIW